MYIDKSEDTTYYHATMYWYFQKHEERLRLIGRTATSSLSSRIFRDGILILFSVQEPIADHLL